MNICIRLPNWLGDMVMSTAFVKGVKAAYPDACIDLVAKKGIERLLEYFPAHNERYVFSKSDYPGLSGAWKFGRLISKKKYDLFFCLPDSFSSAVMAYASGAVKRIGFNKEWRGVALSDTFQKPKGLHRVEEYLNLLQQFKQTAVNIPAVELLAQAPTQKNGVILNINSEAASRRLPLSKAVTIINAVRNKINVPLILVGSTNEMDFVNEVFNALDNKTGISNQAGKTNLEQLIELIASSSAMLTTDSGPAHLSNALGIPTVVLFGAGNEHNTAPYNPNREIIRLGQLPCEPCKKNTCKLYGIPECLVQLDEKLIAGTLANILQTGEKN